MVLLLVTQEGRTKGFARTTSFEHLLKRVGCGDDLPAITIVAQEMASALNKASVNSPDQIAL